MEKSMSRSTNWRDFIPPTDCKRSIELSHADAYRWADLRCEDSFIKEWKEHWMRLHQQPYKGITNDGVLVRDLFNLANEGDDHGAPINDMVKAAAKILSLTGSTKSSVLKLGIDAQEWRAWMNPEIYLSRHGMRLEETSEEIIIAVHSLLRASLSHAGYTKIRGCMNINHFLGETVNGTGVLNVNSYNFTLFGTPSTSEPWGWQIFGHHLSMNCFVLRTQMVISPVFMGAEPNCIDRGPNAGTELFVDQEQTALKLISSFTEAERSRVCVYQELQGIEYPGWRYHKADQRHLGGAFQDNRVIPYEGELVSTFSSTQQDIIRKLLTLSLDYLPERVLAIKLRDIENHWDATYFAWIGHFTRDEGFYYKIHSPVVLIEFDHHSGVFLNNALPLPFHIHTTVRTPNGNDYGKALLELYRIAGTTSSGSDIHASR
ncbi:uncharacterized protein AB675_8 [Cyphellophora attinorum]|uniref:DUF3500 domain-containing protein n=1 Tax=Cyphellophora attinorum TaxID=1664694 RepID=A0A0N1HKH6_9EURO|nr:uncharacterized protein AB675_8 [Phialophora attinorum]KPI34760.1 hypothetical protein AB675_8 [Phialophora attinorum]